MNSKISKPSSSGLHSKIAQPTDCNHSPALRKFADGGAVNKEDADKMAGMEASKDDNVGFFERLKMGNIDEKGSQAYNRFGAGRVNGDAAEMTRESRRGAPADKFVDDAPTAAQTPADEPTYKADESASLASLAASRADSTSSMQAPKAALRTAAVPASPAKRVAKSMAKAMSDGGDEVARKDSDVPSTSIMNPQTGFQLVRPAPKPVPKVVSSPVKTYAPSGRNYAPVSRNSS